MSTGLKKRLKKVVAVPERLVQRITHLLLIHLVLNLKVLLTLHSQHDILPLLYLN